MEIEGSFGQKKATIKEIRGSIPRQRDIKNLK
jgi:hypothetical protein